jgi:hypothetical protein
MNRSPPKYYRHWIHLVYNKGETTLRSSDFPIRPSAFLPQPHRVSQFRDGPEQTAIEFFRLVSRPYASSTDVVELIDAPQVPFLGPKVAGVLGAFDIALDPQPAGHLEAFKSTFSDSPITHGWKQD